MYEQLSRPEGWDFAPLLGIGMFAGAFLAALFLVLLLVFMRPR